MIFNKPLSILFASNYIISKLHKKIKLIASIFLCLFFLQISSLAQNVENIFGKITDEKGNPLVGASVQVKGKKLGTSTNSNGEFVLATPGNVTLIVSYIGFETQEIVVADKRVINASLKPSTNTTDAVVVVGYGTSRKKDLVGSSVSIKGSEILNTVGVSAAQALQGKAAGVQITNSGAPGSAPKIRIRGTGSILGGVDPLYVVDGIITDDIRNINTADILSIDVLKDASSTAIYGARASNGVILITTIAGKSGKLTIKYNAFTGFSFLTHKVTMAGANAYANYSNKAAAAPAILESDITGSTDWYDEITRPASFTSNAISISGGIKKYKAYLSLGLVKYNGILLDNDYQRATVRLNHDISATKKLKIGNTIAFSHYVSNNQPYSLFTQAYNASPIFKAYNANGTFGNTGKSDVGNPLATIKNNFDRSFGSRVESTIWGEYTIMKGLSFKSSYGIDLQNNNSFAYQPVYATYSAAAVPVGQHNDLSNLRFSRDSNYHWTWDSYFTYEKVLNKNHNFKITVGHTVERKDGYGNSSRIEDGSAPDNRVGSTFIFANNSKLWNTNFTDTAHKQINTPRTAIGDYFKRESYFARLNYNFSDKYLLTATFRRDGSSNFSPNNRWGNFTSVGVGWVITKENFMADQHLFNNLKLRASYGKVGNDVVEPSAFAQVPQQFLYSYIDTNRINGTTITKLKDPNLKWEEVKEFDIGIDFAVLDNKLTGEIDYYSKKTKDGLYRITIPSIGFDNAFITNAADISNKGLELALAWANKINKNTNYSIKGNITFNKNKIVKTGNGQNLFSGDLGNGKTSTKTTEGQEIGTFFVYETNGIFQNNTELSSTAHLPNAVAGDFRIVDRNKDGIIDENDKYYAGSYQPKFFYGFNASLNWKQFDVSFDVFGVNGNKVYNAKKGIRYGGNYNLEQSIAIGYWTPGSGINNIPRAFNGSPEVTDYYLESGSFLRINNITTGYKFKIKEKNNFFKSIRLYLSAQNPYIFTKYSGFTPELPGDQLSSGIENNIYPISASYMIGINVQFK
jgi:TonB-dependent starch-binding outer membrane protein SusC